MVLFKRKPVQYLALPRIENDETEVWEIKQTGEIFVDYESYLARMEFYKQRRFICQITGHSGLTFFEALNSEHAGAQEVEEAFPEALKGPILRRVQFQTISRIDNLVDLIYEEFRGDYYPGEIVTVHVVTGERLTGVVRDKTSFGAKVLPDGSINPPFSRYFVSLDNRPKEEAVVDEAHISRDRKIFTKQVLRSFIKKSVTRESWTGAPWQVKHDVAKKYHIDIRIPHHLLFANKANERKNKISQSKKTSNFDGKAWNSPRKSIQNGRHSELKVILETQKSKQDLCKQQVKNKKQMSSDNSAQPSFSHQTTTDQIPYASHTFQVFASHSQVEPHSTNFRNSTFSFAPVNSPPQLANPTSQVKYPIDDLQVPPRLDGLKRPALKFLSQDIPSSAKTVSQAVRGIEMKSVGGLLETWDLLNVFCEVLVLDSFTFDDFVEAMQLSSENVFECELFTEIHCAVLKMLVDSEQDGGKLLVSLPEMEHDREIDDEAGEQNLIPTPILDLDSKPRGRTTRSSLARAELTIPPKKVHRGAEVYAKINWIDELRSRKLDDGGWQFILIGLLYQLSKNPHYHDICETLLQELAPHNLEPTPDTAEKRYSVLNVNLRVQVLEILCRLIVDTQAIRNYMEECSEQMTCFRKEKIQWQRDRKQYLEELRILNEDLKTFLPSEVQLSPNSENKDLYKILSRKIDDHNLVENDILDTDEDLRPIRSLRGGQDRNLERKRKRTVQQEKKDKAEPDSKKSKNLRQYTKVLKEIQKKQESVAKCESEISTLDNDLREADCPRTRILGRDRFWNRYFWFERNGMPYGGLPDSSTAHADYANGCLWIQGPGDLEREGFVEMKGELQDEYVEKFQMTVTERKKNEEGSTSVFNVFQWGYYEDPEAVDELIAWLDIRGCNEQKLHKELKLYRDRIKSNMIKRKNYLKSWHDEIPETSTRRMATRWREPSTKNLKYRCLAWRNHRALSKIGHLHSEQPRTRRSTKKGTQHPTESERPSKIDTKNKNKRKLNA